MDGLQINYSSRPPAHQRRWFRRALILGALACLLPALWHWGPAAWQRTRVLYWQHRAMGYAAPADQIVYDDDPADASTLAKTSPDYLALGATGNATARWAREWKEFSAAFSPPGTLPNAVLFLHERQAGSNGPRLVVVSLYPQTAFGGSSAAGLEIRTDVIQPGNLLSLPARLTSSIWFSQRWADPGNRPVRFFAGQIDPADASHFTLRVLLKGTPHILDGWLMDDDKLRLQERAANP